MPPTFRTPALAADAQPGAVVVHCSDPRFQPHFQHFLGHGLALGHYALIALPGGAQLLTPNDLAPKFAWACWRWTKFMVARTRPARFILIAHEDCRWYIENGVEADPARLRDRQLLDLRRVRAELAERFPGLPVELYYARLAGGSAEFEAL